MATRTDRNIPRRRIADDRGIHVNFITLVTVDDRGRLIVETRGKRTPTTLGGLPDTPAGRQITNALLKNLHINGGTWTSIATFEKQLSMAKRLLSRLSVIWRIGDLKDDGLTPEMLWQAVLWSGASPGGQRNLRTFLADTIILVRDDGHVFRDALYGRTLPSEKSTIEGYAPEVANAIESVARQRIGDWYQSHRSAVTTALGTLPRNWLTIGPEALVTSREKACPPEFTVTISDLAAAMVLLALLDDKGPNLSTIQSYSSDSVERAGNETAFVTGIKPRNREVLRTPAPAGGLFSYAGLVEFVTAATRVDRHFRNYDDDFDRLLFVATGGKGVLSYAQVNWWWRTTAPLWPDSHVPRPHLIEFRRLRKAALLRGKHKGFDVIGHKPPMGRLYLADALPDVILIPGLLATQKSMGDYWRSKLVAIGEQANIGLVTVSEEIAEAGERLKAADEIMDVGVAACVSNGQSPTNQTLPCGLGPVACFLCPNGFRTPEIIPGLIAAVQFTDNIRKYEPEEWLTGEAAILNQLARKSLAQFPARMVEAVPPEAIANSRVLIACVYLEGRSVA